MILAHSYEKEHVSKLFILYRIIDGYYTVIIIALLENRETNRLY
jgi:hypothetical protein